MHGWTSQTPRLVNLPDAALEEISRRLSLQNLARLRTTASLVRHSVDSISRLAGASHPRLVEINPEVVRKVSKRLLLCVTIIRYVNDFLDVGSHRKAQYNHITKSIKHLARSMHVSPQTLRFTYSNPNYRPVDTIGNVQNSNNDDEQQHAITDASRDLSIEIECGERLYLHLTMTYLNSSRPEISLCLSGAKSDLYLCGSPWVFQRLDQHWLDHLFTNPKLYVRHDQNIHNNIPITDFVYPAIVMKAVARGFSMVPRYNRRLGVVRIGRISYGDLVPEEMRAAIGAALRRHKVRFIN